MSRAKPWRFIGKLRPAWRTLPAGDSPITGKRIGARDGQYFGSPSHKRSRPLRSRRVQSCAPCALTEAESAAEPISKMSLTGSPTLDAAGGQAGDDLALDEHGQDQHRQCDDERRGSERSPGDL